MNNKEIDNRIKPIGEMLQDKIDRLENENFELKELSEKLYKVINLMASHIKHPKVIFTGGRGHQHIIEYFENKVKESK